MIVSHRQKRILTARPYSGEGVSVYASDGNSVEYIRQFMLGNQHVLRTTNAMDFQDWPRTPRIAAVASPGEEYVWTIPASRLPGAGLTKNITIDVRPYKDDIEMQTSNFRTRTVEIDENGDIVTVILGSGSVIRQNQLAGGDVEITFEYYASPNGGTPDLFRLSRTAGPTSPSDLTVPFVSGTFRYTATLESLSDASSYTYTLSAENTAGTVTLDLETGITVDADASGPPAPGSVTAEAI